MKCQKCHTSGMEIQYKIWSIVYSTVISMSFVPVGCNQFFSVLYASGNTVKHTETCVGSILSLNRSRTRNVASACSTTWHWKKHAVLVWSCEFLPAERKAGFTQHKMTYFRVLSCNRCRWLGVTFRILHRVALQAEREAEWYTQVNQYPHRYYSESSPPAMPATYEV